MAATQDTKLLAVFPDPPWRGGSGSHMRDLEHLHSLVQLGLKPAVLCFSGADVPPQPPEWLRQEARLLPFANRSDDVAPGGYASILRGLRYLWGDSLPQRAWNGKFAYPSNYLYDEVDGLEQVCRAAEQAGASTVVLRSWFLPWARTLKQRGLTVIIDAHDSASRAATEIFWTLPPLRRWLSFPMVIATRRMEPRYLRFCDEVWAPSQEDAEAIRGASPGVRCIVYPNLVPFPRLEAPPNGKRVAMGIDVLFVGNMAYPPNAEAAEWLVQRVLPALRQRQPGIVTTIVGHGAPESVVRIARSDPSIVVAGRVPDVAGFYARASVVVVPVLRGTGTKVKLLEGLAFGKALVSTPKGVEGIHAAGGEHLLVADGPEAFAEAITRLLGDASLRTRLGTSGRELVERAYATNLGPRILAAESLLCG